MQRRQFGRQPLCRSVFVLVKDSYSQFGTGGYPTEMSSKFIFCCGVSVVERNHNCSAGSALWQAARVRTSIEVLDTLPPSGKTLSCGSARIVVVAGRKKGRKGVRQGGTRAQSITGRFQGTSHWQLEEGAAGVTTTSY